jgi:hypothetical protein
VLERDGLDGHGPYVGGDARDNPRVYETVKAGSGGSYDGYHSKQFQPTRRCPVTGSKSAQSRGQP